MEKNFILPKNAKLIATREPHDFCKHCGKYTKCRVLYHCGDDTWTRFECVEPYCKQKYKAHHMSTRKKEITKEKDKFQLIKTWVTKRIEQDVEPSGGKKTQEFKNGYHRSMIDLYRYLETLE